MVEYSDHDENSEGNEAGELVVPSAVALWPVEEDDSSIVETMSDEEMSAVCPAIAFGYLYTIDFPEDHDHSVELSADLEYRYIIHTNLASFFLAGHYYFSGIEEFYYISATVANSKIVMGIMEILTRNQKCSQLIFLKHVKFFFFVYKNVSLDFIL